MSVCFVFCRIEKFGAVIWIGSCDCCRWYDPNADAFHSAGVDIACVFQCHRCITRVKTTTVAVFESVFTSDEDFVKWPVFHVSWLSVDSCRLSVAF